MLPYLWEVIREGFKTRSEKIMSFHFFGIVTVSRCYGVYRNRREITIISNLKLGNQSLIRIHFYWWETEEQKKNILTSLSGPCFFSFSHKQSHALYILMKNCFIFQGTSRVYAIWNVGPGSCVSQRISCTYITTHLFFLVWPIRYSILSIVWNRSQIFSLF